MRNDYPDEEAWAASGPGESVSIKERKSDPIVVLLNIMFYNIRFTNQYYYYYSVGAVLV